MKKEHKIEIRVSLLERKIIKNKAEKSGCTVSEFIRNIALGYTLTYKLTPEELEVYKTLSKYNGNFISIKNLFKKGDISGVKQYSIETAQLIQKHLSKLK